MTDHRTNPRTPMKVKLKIGHPIHGDLMVTTRDISDSGVYILLDQAQQQLSVGEQVSGQVQGLPIPAPILQMRVVRVEAVGVGLVFLLEE